MATLILAVLLMLGAAGVTALAVTLSNQIPSIGGAR